MVRLQLILRTFSTTNKIKRIPSCYNPQRLFSSKSDEKDGSDSDKKKPGNEKTLNRLNTLLQQMVQNDNTRSKLNLARPKNHRETRSEPGTKSVKSEPIEKKIVNAVKDVAASIGGNSKQTESELLSKLLNPAKENDEANSSNLTDIVKGMKIDRETKAPEAVSRANQVRQLLERTQKKQRWSAEPRTQRPQRRPRDEEHSMVVSEPVDIFGSEPLGIFTSAKFEESEMNKMWTRLYERDLKLAVTHPPSNYYQEMILWTEQGKVWKFPIDNEQGMEEEQNVYFAEHVFLDKYLDGWCPQKGPIRHFMELVTVGLSKNHYLTVKEKQEHIEWYKNYFEDKKQLLKDIGALPADAVTPKSKEIGAE